MRKPEWFDKPHSEWPDAAKTFYSIQALWQKRLVEAKAKDESLRDNRETRTA